MENEYIICYNNFKQPITRNRNYDKRDRESDNRGDKKNYGFSKDNLRGMAAMGEHISDQMVAYMDGRMSNKTDDNTAPHGYAHQIAPFAIEPPQRPQSPEPQPRISVWNRGVTRAHQAKKQKSVEFIQQISEQNGH